MPFSREIIKDEKTGIYTETRYMRGESDIAEIKAIVGTKPDGVPVHWGTAGNGAAVLITGEGDAKSAVFLGRDRVVQNGIEVRMFSDAAGKQRAMTFAPQSNMAGHAVRACGELIEVDNAPSVFVIRTRLIPVDGAPPVNTANEGDGLDSKKIEQLLTIAGIEGVKGQKATDPTSAVIANIRAARAKKIAVATE
jgi:hypothetical protein